MNLREINRQEWAEVPFVIRLVGGPADGTEIRWASLPRIWRHPMPTPLSEMLTRPVDELRPGFADRVVTHEQTDSVADDGARLYRVRNS